MTKAQLTEMILAAKRARGVTWAIIAREAGLSEVFTTSACLGENALPPEAASKVAAFLGLGPDVSTAPIEYANKGEAAATISKEPLQYRLDEIIYVCGGTISP